MNHFGTITTQGEGLETLKAYFEMLGNSLPRKLPSRMVDWKDGARYDAPHGFLTIWKDGAWEATFSLASVTADIKRIPGVTVSGSSRP